MRSRPTLAVISLAVVAALAGAAVIAASGWLDNDSAPAPPRAAAPSAAAITTPPTTAAPTSTTPPATSERPVSHAGWLVRVPADFRLGLQSYARFSEFVFRGPKRGLAAPLRACDEKVWLLRPHRVVDDYGLQVSGPEFAATHHVALYLDADTAAAVMARLRARTEGCGLVGSGHGFGSHSTWDFHDGRLGDDSFNATRASLYRGQPTVGLSVYRWVRVGNAIGLVARSGEGTLGLRGDTARADAGARRLAARMCVFAAVRCRG
jgi:hypothetical protein